VPSPHSDGSSPLSEREVLGDAAGGAAIVELAGTPRLSEGTARNYLSEAIQELNTRNRIEAARIAEEKGWL
jgi:two-component system response regulator DesR